MAYNVTVARPARSQSNQATILCVEDNAAYLQLRKALLEKEGYLVLTATTGSRAVAVVRRVPVSVVLSDHVLRGTTGVARAEQLKAIKPHVPFVLYCGALTGGTGSGGCFVS